jgi:hypothetical protein
MVLPRFATSAAAREQLRELFEGEMGLGALCDILCFALPIELEFKQQFLERTDVRGRAHLLLDAIKPPPERDFPPAFSIN